MDAVIYCLTQKQQVRDKDLNIKKRIAFKDLPADIKGPERNKKDFWNRICIRKI
jgi:hypothetical protein